MENTGYNFQKIEKKWQNKWEKEKVLKDNIFSHLLAPCRIFYFISRDVIKKKITRYPKCKSYK